MSNNLDIPLDDVTAPDGAGRGRRRGRGRGRGK